MFGFFKKRKEVEVDPYLKDLINTIRKKSHHIYGPSDIKDVSDYMALKKLSVEERKSLIQKLLQHFYQQTQEKTKAKDRYDSAQYWYYAGDVALAIVGGLLKAKLNYTEEEWTNLFETYKHIAEGTAKLDNYHFGLSRLPITYSIKQLEYYKKDNQLSDKVIDFIKSILAWPEFRNPKSDQYWGSDLKKSKAKLEALVGLEDNPEEFVYQAEDLAEGVNEVLSQIDKHHLEYIKLFRAVSKVSGGKPSAKVSKLFDELIGVIGNDNYRKTLHSIFEIPANLNATDSYKEDENYYRVDYYLCGTSQIFVKGLIWSSTRFSDKNTIRLISKIVEKAYTKIPGKGPAAAAVGNAGVYALGNMRGKDGLGALSRLKLKVRQNNVKKTIDKFMLAGAEKYNVSVEELKEMAVPELGMSKGKKQYPFDDYILNVLFVNSKLTQQWIKPNGDTMKSVPSVVKNNVAHKKKLQNIRKELKEIQKVYSAQKQRIDNQLILDREWDFSSFEKYYIKHGLVSEVAKKLIWSFIKEGKSVNAIYKDNAWYTNQNELVDWIGESTTVKLWHPINATEQEIIDWRECIMQLEWKQPVKQAFREIYLLTDAEVNTKSYSNRMAAHILKQHQFSSLASVRDWKYSLLGAYDDGRNAEVCYRDLPEYNIRAEFWIDELVQDDAWTDSGIWMYIATDQVKFLDTQNETMDLLNVPKIVFSEVMRDVDMFVGVASVGNDPQWMDNNGDRQSNRDYWHGYSFGDLNEIAKTRKTILERLLPRLKKIRDVATIDGKFLKVQGKIRTYKIHIGSGNILMEPNNQYLCIVPSRSSATKTEKLFIPFEGDGGLSIVLSKAFLLAEDDKVTDPTIISQIGRK